MGLVRPAPGLGSPGIVTAGPAGDRPGRLGVGSVPAGRTGGPARRWEVRPITGWVSARHWATAPMRLSWHSPGCPRTIPLTLCGYHEAKANLTHGRLHAAERRLEQTLARGGPGLDQVRDLLSEIYQIEVRFDDDKVLHRAGPRTRTIRYAS